MTEPLSSLRDFAFHVPKLPALKRWAIFDDASWAVSLVEAQPFQGTKKGAATGIDGLKFFRDLRGGGGESRGVAGRARKKEVRKIVVSVKGGGIKPDDRGGGRESRRLVGRARKRALNHVREREKAEIALFISLEPPTAAMVKEAASAGFYAWLDGKRKSPRLQLLTIESLLAQTARAEHPDYEPDLNFKKAKTEAHGDQPELL